jgi:hypothetical protein
MYVCMCLYVYGNMGPCTRFFVYVMHTTFVLHTMVLCVCVRVCMYVCAYMRAHGYAPFLCAKSINRNTAILIIFVGRETAFNGFQYQFTTGKPLKNLKLTLNYYENGSINVLDVSG